MRQWLLALFAAFSASLTAPCWAQSNAEAEINDVFQRLLENPSDVDLNFRYADLAIAQDRLRHALAAYERILATDPENRAAQDGLRRIKQLLKPQFTALTLRLGGQWESNPRLEQSRQQARDDVSALPYVELVDERQISGLRLRSEGELAASFYGRHNDLNYGRAAVNSGPVFALGDWDIRPAVGGAYTWLDGSAFYQEATALLSLAPAAGGTLRRVNLRFSYDWIESDVAQRDAFILEVAPQLNWLGQIDPRDVILVAPFYRYNGISGGGPAGTGARGQSFPLESQQIGARFDYYLPLQQDLAIDLNFTVSYQAYSEDGDPGAGDRRDIYLSPGVQLIVKEVIAQRHDLVFGYQYEDNRSNSSSDDFINHLVSVRSVWRF